MSNDSAATVRLLAAYHEAGHAVACVFWGLKPYSARVSSDGTGHVVHRWPHAWQWERQALVFAAGLSAEFMAGLKRKIPRRKLLDFTTGAFGDTEETLTLLSMFPERERKELKDRILTKVSLWMLRPEIWTAIETVASMLLDRRRLSGPECRAVIKKTLGRRLSRLERKALKATVVELVE